MNKKTIIIISVGLSLVVTAVVLFLIIGKATSNLETENSESTTDTSTIISSSIGETTVSIPEVSQEVDNEDIDESETEETKSSDYYVPKDTYESTDYMPETETAKELKESNKFPEEMSNTYLQKELAKSIDDIDWDNITMTSDEFKEWLEILVPNYLDYTYVTNFVDDSEITVAIIEDDDSTVSSISNKLNNLLLKGIEHSSYKNDNIRLDIYKM